MLYVVVTAMRSQIIIIDEPHAFLHPGALRKLFEILSQEYSQHQYIITTNSPAAILAATPATVYVIGRRQYEATVTRVRTDDSSDYATFLDSVGAHLSDVFGADSILWVEGRTAFVRNVFRLAAHATQLLFSVQRRCHDTARIVRR